MVQTHRRPGGRRAPLTPVAALVSAVLVLALLALTVSGCVSQGVADRANERLNYGMTTAELDLARRVAMDQARKEDAQVTARATVSGTSGPTGSATGAGSEPCTGRLLHITMAGGFPHAKHSGGPVSGQDLTVDATTGRVCDAHYLTGAVRVDPESVVLFSS